ncbi:hypothetical protein AB0J83_03325 [Actinoplanes sp. NPDC049596]|uniref:hypothetical protein n=1 Tax=unclassified Actinoplanes TaxID=2626549 RepID=UPI00342588D6
MPTDIAAEFLTRAGPLCTDQAADLELLVDAVLAALVPPRSPADLDHRVLLASRRNADRQQLWSQIGQAQMHLAVHTIDHVRALGASLADPQTWVPVYAHAGMARSAVESAALLLHLLAEGQPFDVRLDRGVALLIVDAGEAVKAANLVEGNAYMPSPGPVVTAERDRLVALVDHALIERVPNKPGTATKGMRVSPDGREEPVAIRVSELAQAHFGDMRAIYGLLSGVVHGLPWRLADSAHIRGREMLWEPDPVDIGGSVLAALAAASRAGAGFAAYRGFGDHQVVGRLADRAHQADRVLAAFSRQWGVLDGVRPTVARFLQAK